MLTGIHFLLTYRCLLECDHCFLYCGPRAEGTMTLDQVHTVLEEAGRIGTVRDVYFEGGEPFLYYPLMVEGIRMARGMGFEAGIVSNGYWATCPEDAALWLEPLARLGVSDMSVSDDELHFGEAADAPSKTAIAAARMLGMPVSAICKEKPAAVPAADTGAGRGTPEISGGIKLRGRAVEKYAAQLPARDRSQFRTCPYEELERPQRVHVDFYGTVQLCQGISLGNCWETPLSELIRDYDARNHPVCGPLVRGGPIALAGEHNVEPEGEYADECHFCFVTRRALVDKMPEVLAPRQVYGLIQNRDGGGPTGL